MVVQLNANFKRQDQELHLSTNSNGEEIVEGRRLFVSPGSGDPFSVAATDDTRNKLLSNGFIQTERLLHYVEVKMNNLSSIVSNLTIPLDHIKPIIPVCIARVASARRGYIANCLETSFLFVYLHKLSKFTNSETW